MAASKNLTPAERTLRASLAADTMWSRVSDRSARMAAATKAANERFERQVDPNGELSPEERARRGASARSAHMKRLALRSAQARRGKATAGLQAAARCPNRDSGGTTRADEPAGSEHGE